MKFKITRFLSALIICAFTLGLVYSCKKDYDFNSKTNNSSTSISSSNLVTTADLKLWQKESPVAQFIALDWKNAKHIVIDGKKVVKVALLNENRMPVKNKEVTSSSSLKFSNSVNTNFETHPPEVYFVKDGKDSLHTYLLNFIPDDPTKEFGNDKIWTGKLYEWNLNSDSLFVHEYKKNEITKRFILKGNTSVNINANNQIKTDSFWSWLGDAFDAIVEFLNDIGYLLHIPGTTIDYSRKYPLGNERGWPSFQFVGDIFTGNGGGGGGGGTTEGHINDGGTGWSGGGNFYLQFFNPPVNGPNAGDGIVSQAGVHLISELAITEPELQNLLLFNNEISDQLLSYLEIHGSSQENKDFIKWAIIYLNINNNVSIEDFANEYLRNKPNINDVVLPELIDTAGLSAFPKFKEIITNLPAFLNAYPNVKKALAYYTGFTEAEVMSKMQPGKGPKIQVVTNFPATKYAHYNALTKTLQINISYVNGLEVAQLPKTIQATALLLAITTFHEFVHYGRNVNKLTYDYTDPLNGNLTEAGWTFEQNISPNGLGINKYNAITWLYFYNFNF